jgi:ABC-type antimicrobial peptide transport system permease subunit
VKNLAITEERSYTVYVPASQLTRVPDSTAWVIRETGNSSLIPMLRRAVTAVRPNQRVLDSQTMSDVVAHSMARPSFNASLMSTFAALALILTSVGIYGLLSFQVARRTQEIGIRMALGAKRTTVLLMIVKQGTLLAGAGIAIGAVGAVFLARFVSSLIVGIRTNNPLIYLLVSILLLCVAMLASYVPARRASKVDPLVALRYE